MIHLQKITRTRPLQGRTYPFTIGPLRQLETLTFPTPITIFIGENGTGKTTLLESLVQGSNMISLIPEDYGAFDHVADFASHFRFTWSKKTRKGFYLKSQSFITYIRQLTTMKHEAKEGLDRIKRDMAGKSAYTQALASQPHANTLHALQGLYGEGLDKKSHGEGYLELFKSRLKPGGLYLLDEPELSLSPMRQLALIAMIKDMVRQDAQFILITHSPILMAMDGATIYDFNTDQVSRTTYEDIEHVSLTRDFLNDPQSFLRHL